ncbi:MAG: amidohydrolase family protein [Lentisphaerae bacterium]|nr:amidohydrolase family protein [Lentisphaerota bacterium]
MKIDSHQHFWKYSVEEYGWIDDDMKSIRRDFLPEDLEKETRSVGIDGVVSVQARQTVAETECLLGFSQKHDFIKGVVGWVPLISSDVRECLSGLTSFPKLKSVRHVVQGEPDNNFILRNDFNEGISALREFGLAYDILILEKHLPQTIKFVDMHPDQIFILDHIAKPRIKENILEPWRKNIMSLSERKNVYCKFSGMVTEADYGKWTEDQLRPYFETVLEAFGPERLMFGSDWPVCTVACEYRRWLGTVREFISNLSSSEQDSIFGVNAVRAYNLTV